jgi:hypothetical protein
MSQALHRHYLTQHFLNTFADYLQKLFWFVILTGQDVKLVSETTKLKFAVLCIGGTLTMDSEEAIRAPGLLQCKDVMGVHYDTFP